MLIYTKVQNHRSESYRRFSSTVSLYTATYDKYKEHPQYRKSEGVFLYAKKATRASLLFHELAENYYRTVEGKEFEEAHKNAISDQEKLKEGHPAHSPTPGKGIIIDNPSKQIVPNSNR